MRTQAEVDQAAKLFKAYLKAMETRRSKAGRDSFMNTVGTFAALQWMLGDDDGPVAGILRDLPLILRGIDPDSVRN